MGSYTPLARYTLATDLFNALSDEIDKLTNYRDINISDTSNIILACVNLEDSDDTESLAEAYDSFMNNLETYVPMFEINPSEDNEFFNDIKSLYAETDLSGISTPTIDNFDADNTSAPITEFGQNFLFYSSSNIITGMLSKSLVDYPHDDFIVAAYISSLAHNTSVSKLAPIINNATNIAALLNDSFSDIINSGDLTDLITQMNSILAELYITTEGNLDIDQIIGMVVNTNRGQNIKNIMYLYDMFFNTIYGQIITMGYSLSDNNYKINLTTLQSMNPLP